MPLEITQIRVALPYRLGSVNCYLIKTETGFVLIDTGSSNGRAELEHQLERAGCKPGNLRLILLTHGDFDHTGNAAHLRKRFFPARSSAKWIGVQDVKSTPASKIYAGILCAYICL